MDFTRLLSLIGIKGKDGNGISSVANPVPVEVENTVAVTGPLTDAQLRASAVPVSGTFSGSVDLAGDTADLDSGAGSDPHGVVAIGLPASGGHVVGGTSTNPFRTDTTGTTTQPVSGPLTDAQLRATPVPVSGDFSSDALTDAELRATAVPVSGPLTDAQLRAAAVPVSGTVAVTGTIAINAEKVEDTASASGATGVFILGVRNDGGAVRTTADGDYSPISVDSTGNVRVLDRASRNEDAAHGNTDLGHFVLGVRNDAGATKTDADGDYSAFATDPAGRVGIADLGGSITVDNAVLSVVGAGAEATAQRVTLSTESLAALETVSIAGTVPVSGPLTDAQLRATAVPVSGTVTATGPLTDTQLRATAVPVSGTVTATGPLTDAQLRASAVPVSGPLTDTQLRATPVPVSGTVAVSSVGGTVAVSGPLTDAQLRATAVPVSGPLTDTQLRASAVPVSAASLPLPSGAATSANQSTEITALQLIDDIPTAEGGTVVKGAPIMGVLDDVGTTAATENAASTARITAQRALHTNLRNVAGTEVGTAAAPIRTDPTGTTTQPVSGTVTVTPSGTQDTNLKQVNGTTQTARDWSLDLTKLQNIPTSPSTLGEQQTQTTSLQLLDDTVATTGSAIPTKGQAVSGTDGTNARVLKTDSSGELQIDVLTSALPTGASTLAEQQTQTTSLQLLDDAVATTGGAIPTKGFTASGTDGTNARVLKTDASGELQIDVLTSALPTGAATAANQQTNALTDAQLRATAVPVSGTVTANAGTGPFPVSDNAGSLTVDAPVATPVFVRLSDGSAAIATLPVSAASLPLPAGAATSALQTQPGVDIGDVTVNNASGASAVNIQDGGNSITVDGTVAATQSGTWTEANSAAIKTSVELIDDAIKAEDAAHSTDDKGIMALGVRKDVAGTLVDADGDYAPLQFDSSGNLRTTASASGTFSSNSEYDEDSAHASASKGMFILGVRNDAAAARTSTDGDYSPLAVDSAGRVGISDLGGSLTVDGAVTANAGTNLNTSALALESGGNLASIKAKTDNIPAQGQALAAASLPVVLTAAQVTTLTPPAAITGFATSANQIIRDNLFASLIKYEAQIGQELVADDIIGGDLYHGRATDLTATSAASWEVVRFYRSATGAITRTRYRTGVVWDSRTSGW